MVDSAGLDAVLGRTLDRVGMLSLGETLRLIEPH